MNLKTFNATNVASIREMRPFIGLNQKTGLFNFNRAACDMIGLQDGDQIQFHQDADNEETWYLEVVTDSGFILRKKDNVTSGLLFNNTQMVRKIFQSMAYVENGGRILIGEVIENKKQKLITLVTASLKNN
jgi:hypothetical protein